MAWLHFSTCVHAWLQLACQTRLTLRDAEEDNHQLRFRFLRLTGFQHRRLEPYSVCCCFSERDCLELLSLAQLEFRTGFKCSWLDSIVVIYIALMKQLTFSEIEVPQQDVPGFCCYRWNPLARFVNQ